MVTSSTVSGSSTKTSSCDWLPAYKLLLSTTEETLPTRSYSPDLSKRRRRSMYLAILVRSRPTPRQTSGVMTEASTRAIAPYSSRVVTDGPGGRLRLGSRRPSCFPDELCTRHRQGLVKVKNWSRSNWRLSQGHKMRCCKASTAMALRSLCGFCLSLNSH